jgi:D-lactate dehydrogenase
MKVAVFSCKDYERAGFSAANEAHEHQLVFYEERLSGRTASLAYGAGAVCVFVNDVLEASTIGVLAANGTKLVATRSVGFKHVDLAATKEHGVTLARVPGYSTAAVAEHVLALILAVNRRLHRAHNRVREGNYLLSGLVGRTLESCTVGLVGTGKTGAAVAKRLAGFGCEIVAHDPNLDPDLEALGVRYVALDELYASANVISLHCPLSKKTQGLLDADAFGAMQDGVLLVNSGRAALIVTDALIEALKSGKVRGMGIDLFEEDGAQFFEEHSDAGVQSDALARLVAFPNVLVTAHQGFLTEESLREVAETTLANVTAFEKGDWEPGPRFR